VAGTGRRDVISAYLVAIATAAAGGALLLMARRPGTRHALWHRRQARSSWPFWIAVIALAAALFTVSIIILVSTVIGLRWDKLGGAEFNIAYFAGMTASTAAGVFLMASLIALFSGIDFGGVNG
jgi:archaellum biogenesis protein FlaJ (TadC family)